jgi:hypothetical protein
MNENEKDLRLTDFDYQFADPKLQMVKAAIPYLSVPQQRIFALMVRLQETRRTMDLLSGGEMAAMGIGSESPKPHSFLEILQAIKPYAGPREREIIENFENMHLMIQAMQTSA